MHCPQFGNFEHVPKSYFIPKQGPSSTFWHCLDDMRIAKDASLSTSAVPMN